MAKKTQRAAVAKKEPTKLKEQKKSSSNKKPKKATPSPEPVVIDDDAAALWSSDHAHADHADLNADYDDALDMFENSESYAQEDVPRFTAQRFDAKLSTALPPRYIFLNPRVRTHTHTHARTHTHRR